MKKIIILLLTSLLIITGCDSTAESKIDPEKSKIKTEAANTSFSDAIVIVKDKMEPLVCDDYDCPDNKINEASDMDDMDFTVAYSLYNEAVTADPSNLDAQLGAAITRILSLLKDPEFIKLRNAWWNANDDFNLNSASLSEARLKLSAFINDALLPSIDYSLARLAILDTEENKDYTYLITPEFYSEEEGDTFELDMTEIKLFRSSLLAVKAFVNLTQAYKIDLDNYSLIGIKSALTKGSDFLTLLDSNKMINAHSLAKEAVDKGIEAINFLLVENDDQDDDILRNSSNNIQDIYDFKDGLLKIQDMLSNSYELKNNGVTLSMNLSSLFNNAPEDLKELLPNYTVTIEADELKIEPEAEDKVSLIIPDTNFSGLFEGTISQEEIKVFLGFYECTSTIACYDGDTDYHCNDNFNCEYGAACTDDNQCDSWSHCSTNGYCEYGTRCSDDSACDSYEHCSDDSVCEYGTRCSDNSACDSYEHCSNENICEDGAVCTTNNDCYSDEFCNADNYCEWTKK